MLKATPFTYKKVSRPKSLTYIYKNLYYTLLNIL